MSKTCYTYRPDAVRPIGSLGPLTEIDDQYHFAGDERRLAPTEEQELQAGWCNGPNFAEMNAIMIMRSLGLDDHVDKHGEIGPLDAADFKARLLTALAVGGAIADDGIPDVVSDRMQIGGHVVTTVVSVFCGVRAGYFADAYRAMLPVAEQAVLWGTDVHFA